MFIDLLTLDGKYHHDMYMYMDLFILGGKYHHNL